MKKRFENVDKAIAGQQLWRAKEILSGMMSGKSYDIQLFDRMGQVLLQMGDVREAGKYLFLAGNETSDAHIAIEIFLSKAPTTDFTDFWGIMPTRAKYASLSDLPVLVKDALEKYNFSPEEIDLAFEAYGKARVAHNLPSDFNAEITPKEKVILGLVLTLIVIFLMGFLYQAGLGLGALWQRFAG